MRDVMLVTVSGEDKPGVSASLLGILAGHGAPVLDIGQAVIHQTLSLGILTQSHDDQDWDAIRDELQAKAAELDMKVKVKAVPLDDYADWVQAQGKARHIVTLLGRVLTADHLERVTHIIKDQGLNIDVITRLSGRVPLDGTPPPAMACVEMSVRGTPVDMTALRAALVDLAHEVDIDIAFQVDDVYRRNRRLIALDMDSTLIQVEVIDELAKLAGVADQVAPITERAMRGEIDFRESLSQRVALLEGLEEEKLEALAETLPLTDGAERLVSTVKQLGYKVAVLSGGFTFFGNVLRERLGVDYVFANELEMDWGKLTGKLVGDIVDAERKAELLREIADREDISMEQVVAVGDGANDLPMLAAAGLGIAFRAKPLVRESAGHSLSAVGLDGILYLLGVRDREAH